MRNTRDPGQLTLRIKARSKYAAQRYAWYTDACHLWFPLQKIYESTLITRQLSLDLVFSSMTVEFIRLETAHVDHRS